MCLQSSNAVGPVVSEKKIYKQNEKMQALRKPHLKLNPAHVKPMSTFADSTSAWLAEQQPLCGIYNWKMQEMFYQNL